MVDGDTSEWIPILPGVPPGRVLGPLLFVLYTSKIFELVENRLYVYVVDSTLLTVVRKPADRHTVAASLNRDWARIQEWCNRWYMTLNENKTKALVVSRSKIVNPARGDLVLSMVLSELVPSMAF